MRPGDAGVGGAGYGGRAGAGGARRRTVRTRLAWSFTLVIMVTGLGTVLALSAIVGNSLIGRPPVLSVAPSAMYLHTFEPDPAGDGSVASDPVYQEFSSYTMRLFTASEFDRLWAGTAGRRLAGLTALAVVTVLIVAASSGYVLARGVAGPLTKLAGTVQELSASSLSRRLDPPETDDELGQLASAFNGMLDRLEGSFKDMEAATSYVSHELRTSLAVIRTHLEVGLAGARDLESAARKALDATAKATAMVEEALALASRSIPGQAAPVDLALLVAEVVDDYSLPGRTIEFDLPPDGVPPIKGSATWLHRAIANLVDNAFRHGPAAGPVAVRVARRFDAVIVSVEDKGPGIPEDEQESIWDRFHRAGGHGGAGAGEVAGMLGGGTTACGDGASAKASGHGYGLGLSLVRQAVEAAGGAVWLRSKPGEGTTFYLSIPVWEPPAGPPPKAGPRAEANHE